MGLVDIPDDASVPTNVDRVNTEYGAQFSRYKIETKTTALTLEWDINDLWRLKSVTAARSVDNIQVYDFDGSSQQFITNLMPRKADDYSQELQLNFSGDVVNAVAGFYYLDARQESLTRNTQYARLLATRTLDRTTLNNKETLKSSSAYLTVDWNFARDWQLSLGGRYTTDKKSISQLERADQGFFALAMLNGFPPSAIVAVTPGKEAIAELSPMFGGWVANSRYFELTTLNPLSGGGKWSEFTPSFKLTKFVSDDVLMYIGYSTGFKTGGYNPIGSGNTLKYDPETVDSYIFGIKATLGENFRINGELFYNDYKDKQLATIVMMDDALIPLNNNVGKMKTKGAEIEILWAPIEDFLFGFNIGYLDTEINSYTTTSSSGDKIDIARSSALGFSPKWTAQASMQYGFMVNDRGRVTLGVDVAYRDESYTNSPIDLLKPLGRIQVQESHKIWNAVIAWSSPKEAWRIALEGRNLDDKRVLTNTYLVGPFVTGAYTTPRTWAMSIGYSY